MHQTFEEHGFALPDKIPNLLWSDSGDFQHSFVSPDKQRLWRPRPWEILARAVCPLLLETLSLPMLIFHLEIEQRQRWILRGDP